MAKRGIVITSKLNFDGRALSFGDGFPNEVVKANVRGDCLIKAWREYFKLTQAALAKKAGMKQSALARLERSNVIPRRSTLAKLSDAMGITVEQLIE